MPPLPWPALLDALEERNRRFDALLCGGDGEVPDVPLHADSPLPPELALRAQVLLDETERLTRLATTRSAHAERGLRYARP
jgi:hypothetical protein